VVVLALAVGRVEAALARTRTPLHVFVGVLHLVLGLLAQVVHAVPPVQRVSDLFVGVHKTLQLHVQVSVLPLQHIAVVVQSVDFCSHIVVSCLH